MDAELKIVSGDLRAAMAKLSKSGPDALQSRRQKIAMLIKLHVQHIQHNVMANRRRRQQRTRRRLQLLRSLFMKQMMELQTSYVEMYATLRNKHTLLRAATDEQPPGSVTAPAMAFQDLPLLSSGDFLKHMHVTRRTFQWLCDQLAPTLSTTEELHHNHQPMPSENCVALALYYLANEHESMRLMCEHFALPRMRIIKCLRAFCNAVMATFGKALQSLPQRQVDCDSVVAGFRRESNMPAALIGVLGVCSISKRDKCSSSMVRMEYLLDDRMLFRELKLSDARKSPMPPMFGAAPNPLTQLPARLINERLVPPFVLAPVHQNFPLRPWMLQRYLDPVAPHEYDFNEVAELLHNLSDGALERLVSRWPCLSQPLDISYHTAACIITAACVLYNVLEQMNEPHMTEWSSEVDAGRLKSEASIPRPDACEEAELALEMRDFLARTISSTEMETQNGDEL